MSLIDDLKTFLTALAVGVALTVSINYAVVNYTEGSKSARAASQPQASQPAKPYTAPSPLQTTDTSAGGYAAYY
jgi:hypothetical protein